MEVIGSIISMPAEVTAGIITAWRHYWKVLWRRRFPMTAAGTVHLTIPGPLGQRVYTVLPMPCGCGYRVFHAVEGRIGGHRPTLGGAIRQARRHAERS